MLIDGVAEMDLAPVLAAYHASGWAWLGRVASDDALAAMRARADALMMGQVSHDGVFFQVDNQRGGAWQGPRRDYRKIEKLQKDPVFLAWLENPLFERIARGLAGGDVTLYRALLMTKSEQGGSYLPWHQDAGLMWGLDRDPVVQIWTALDDAPAQAGCVEVLGGSHAAGLVTPLGGVVPTERVPPDAESRVTVVPARAGEAMLIHNHVWHRSGINVTGRTRRAFSVCYLHATTRCTRTRHAPRAFPRVFTR